MNTARVAHGASPGAAPKVTTLRTLIEGRRAEGRRFSLDEAIAIIVPLCLDLKERHDRGERLYVHPGCIAPGGDGLARLAKELAVVPTNTRDRMCLAPELQATLEAGDARASVFSVGAVLYELVTGEHIGPAMRRPKDIDPELPESLEGVLAKALVGDPAHRPNDLGALASAMHHVAPMKSIPPPDADESRLDHTESFDVDIRLSMLPPSEVAPSNGAMAAMHQDPYAAVMAGNISQPSKNDPTARLGALKARLESDPRPRYVVNKDKMDHGPFSAVELLQQITSNSFTGDHILRDEISGQAHPIKEWEEFAQFSDQAALKREIVAEKKAVERVAEDEKKAGFAKSTVGIAVVMALLAVVGVFIFKAVGSRNDSVKIADDKGGVMVDPAGSIKGQKRNTPGGGGFGGTGMPGGLSFEAAWATAEQKVDLAGPKGRDLTQEELGRPMQNASFISGCGAPDSMHVTVKVAVKMGRAVGVSAYTTPPSPGVSACIANAVRGMSWPVSQNMDAVTTNY